MMAKGLMKFVKLKTQDSELLLRLLVSEAAKVLLSNLV